MAINDEKDDPNKGGKSRLVKVLLKPAKFAEFEMARQLANFGGYGHLSDYFNYLFDQREQVERWRREIITDVAKLIKRFAIADEELRRAKEALKSP